MLDEKQMLNLRYLIAEATRKQLDEIMEILNHEIYLSDKTIKEGVEIDDRN